MGRKLGTVSIALAIALSPAPARADGCEWAAAFTAGLFIAPVLASVALQAAACAGAWDDPPRPVYIPVPVSALPPEPPDDAAVSSGRASVHARSLRAGDSAIGEVRGPARADPAGSEAEALLARGESYRAAEAYRALAIERPADPRIAPRFSEALLVTGSGRYAEHQLRRALRSGIDPPEIGIRGPAGKLGGATASVEKRLQPGDGGPGRLIAAFGAMGIGDLGRAKTHLDAILASRPEDREAAALRREVGRRSAEKSAGLAAPGGGHGPRAEEP
jgi:hypothetical protein